MKLVVIHGVGHKGSTYEITGHLLKHCAAEEVSEFFLPQDMPHFCIGCNVCFIKGETACPHAKWIQPILLAMKKADVIVMTTPTYVLRTSGQMKALLDHFGFQFIPHRPDPELIGKTGVIISTAAGGGMQSAMKDIATSMLFWGLGRIHKYGIATHAISWDEVSAKKRAAIEKRTEKLAAKLKKEYTKRKMSFKGRAIFRALRIMMMKKVIDNPLDQVHWESQGWFSGRNPW
ncbi:MAG: flavodoxin family protein [Lachnospiraceae bacterium]